MVVAGESFWLEKESLGLGVLDSVFSGLSGVGTMLPRLFGGTAIIQFQVVPGGYDEAAEVNIEPVYALQRIAFTDETYKYLTTPRSVGGVQVAAGDIVGIVPAYDLDREITENADLLQWNGAMFRITATETFFSGQKTALVRILGKRQYEQQLPGAT